ncbi:MAG TPA: di-heme oxidoredictase family protein [Steroidobacteraceae bacterium]|nr:di-heme oxidoredictase family protein [Steroidobacteraceae bacterium]
MNPRAHAALLWVATGACCAVVAATAEERAEFARLPFATRGEPPSYRPLSVEERTAVELGRQVFNTHWVGAGTPGAGRQVGLGPLFNAPSCDACHNDGGRGTGPEGDGEVQAALVVQLAAPHRPGEPVHGDPVYGRTFNPLAIDGVKAEGRVFVRYEDRSGRYADGSEWHVRVPHYELRELAYGPLAPDTVIGPRVAPAVFGTGLLEAARVTPAPAGRFGWQSGSVSVRDQTTRAFAGEMGVTSPDKPSDDCTAAEVDCRRLSGTSPEVGESLLGPLVGFQRLLAVPVSAPPRGKGTAGGRIFSSIGCAACHTPSLPVDAEAAGLETNAEIHAYTDLKLHDLGPGLADREVSGRVVPSKWRTAPLWGIGYRPRPTTSLTFLHDGRARTIAEAVLWHDGEGRASRDRFVRLSAADRASIEGWVLSL